MLLISCKTQKRSESTLIVEEVKETGITLLKGPVENLYFDGQTYVKYQGEYNIIKFNDNTLKYIENPQWKKRPAWTDEPEWKGTVPKNIPSLVCLNSTIRHYSAIDSITNQISVQQNLWYVIYGGKLYQEIIYDNGVVLENKIYYESEINHTKRTIDSTETSYIYNDYQGTERYRNRLFDHNYKIQNESWFPDSKLSVNSAHVYFKEVLIGKKYYQPIKFKSNAKETVILSSDNKSQFKFSTDTIKIPQTFSGSIKPGDSATFYLHYSPIAKTFTDLYKISINTNIDNQKIINFYIQVKGGHFNIETLKNSNAITINFKDSVLIIPCYSEYSEVKYGCNDGSDDKILMNCSKASYIRENLIEICNNQILQIEGCGNNLTKEIQILKK